MKRSCWIPWILVALVVALAPIAWASPPDPTWIKGVYDDADFDDVVTYLTSVLAAVFTFSVVDVIPAFAHVPILPAPNEEPELLLLLSSHAPRAPPLA
jgi:hypothetical protein